jgi:hypothetical protein
VKCFAVMHARAGLARMKMERPANPQPPR